MTEEQTLRMKLEEAEQQMESRVAKCSVLRFASEEEQEHNMNMIDYWQARQQVLRAELAAL